MNPKMNQMLESPEARQRRELATMRKALRDEITKQLDENRANIARRAALTLTKRLVMDDLLQDEVEKMRACLDNLLENLFEQFKFDQMEGR